MRTVEVAYEELLSHARSIEREWRKHDVDCEAFPEIVWKVTDEFDIIIFGNLAELVTPVQNTGVAPLRFPLHSPISI